MKIVSTKKPKGLFKRSGALRRSGVWLRTVSAAAAALLAAGCFFLRAAPRICAQSQEAGLCAVRFILPESELKSGESTSAESPPAVSSAPSSQSEPEPSPEASGAVLPQESSSQTPDSSQSQGEGVPILERRIADTGVQYGSIFVRDSNPNHPIDIKAELEKRPDLKIKTDGTPQVLIYHTHTTESYLLWEQNTFQSGTETRSRDNTRNVVLIGEIIAAQLRAAGIGVVHDVTCHDDPAYNGAYGRSAATMEKNLKKYPGIQVTLDVHRDAIGDDSGRTKPTVLVDGKKAAQVMILAGCDDDGTLGFPDWEYNLRLALRLQQSLADGYAGLMRPLNFCPRKYNLNMTHGSLLVEFGTEVNTLEEASYSGELFGKSLAGVLKTLT